MSSPFKFLLVLLYTLALPPSGQDASLRLDRPRKEDRPPHEASLTGGLIEEGRTDLLMRPHNRGKKDRPLMRPHYLGN